jgi:hypothetical protein
MIKGLTKQIYKKWKTNGNKERIKLNKPGTTMMRMQMYFMIKIEQELVHQMICLHHMLLRKFSNKKIN